MNSLLVFDAALFVTFFTFNSGYLDDTPPEISPQGNSTGGSTCLVIVSNPIRILPGWPHLLSYLFWSDVSGFVVLSDYANNRIQTSLGRKIRHSQNR